MLEVEAVFIGHRIFTEAPARWITPGAVIRHRNRLGSVYKNFLTGSDPVGAPGRIFTDLEATQSGWSSHSSSKYHRLQPFNPHTQRSYFHEFR
jgi:hypothetical protein